MECLILDERIEEQNAALDKIAKKLDDVYYKYSSKWGLSEPAFWTLYALVEADKTGEIITQNNLASSWCCPKQTVNFAVSGLMKKGYVVLEKLNVARNSKAVRLTTEGNAFCKSVIIPLIKAEYRALSQLSLEERDMLVKLSEKQCLYLETEINQMLEEKKSNNNENDN